MFPRTDAPEKMPGLCPCWLLCLLSLLALAAPCSGGGESSYRRVTGPCDLEFPRDHGPHPGYATEWWYYTGNVRSEAGRPFGFQLTFFRHQFVPPGHEKSWPEHPSAWRTSQLYIAHLAVSDIAGGNYRHADQMARGAVGLAGAATHGQSTTVFVKDWTVEVGHNVHVLKATAEDFGVELSLVPEKSPALHGAFGYSLKGKSQESASCYYSLSRLRAKGNLTVNGKPIPVQGNAWMDHEFSSAPLESDLVGWDWFSLQFADGTELMIYLLRQKDGTIGSASSGTFIHATGQTTTLNRAAIVLEALDPWQSPHSRGKYPTRWKMKIIPLQMDLTITAQLKDQEMSTLETTRITYWEGSVSVQGTGKDGKPLSGDGYVELTGYDQPLNLPQ